MQNVSKVEHNRVLYSRHILHILYFHYYYHHYPSYPIDYIIDYILLLLISIKFNVIDS